MGAQNLQGEGNSETVTATEQQSGRHVPSSRARLIVSTYFGVFSAMVVIIGAMVLEGGHLSSIIAGPAAIMVFGPLITISAASFAAKNRLGLFPVFTFSKVATDHPDEAAGVCDQVGFVTCVSGTIGVVMGLIHVMENLDRPDSIGPGIAISFICTLYGAAGYFAAQAVRQVYRSLPQFPRPNSSQITRAKGLPMLVGSSVSLLFATFVVLYAIQITPRQSKTVGNSLQFSAESDTPKSATEGVSHGE